MFSDGALKSGGGRLAPPRPPGHRAGGRTESTRWLRFGQSRRCRDRAQTDPPATPRQGRRPAPRRWVCLCPARPAGRGPRGGDAAGRRRVQPRRPSRSGPRRSQGSAGPDGGGGPSRRGTPRSPRAGRRLGCLRTLRRCGAWRGPGTRPDRTSARRGPLPDRIRIGGHFEHSFPADVPIFCRSFSRGRCVAEHAPEGVMGSRESLLRGLLPLDVKAVN